MRTVSCRPLSDRYLSFEEREEIAILKAQGEGVREIARRVKRSAPTISRELRRNAATRGGKLEYRATTAQWHADRRARRPKIAKLAANDNLREYVQDRLAGVVAAPSGTPVPGPTVRWIGRRRGRRQDRRWAKSWSPEQISNGTVALAHPPADADPEKVSADPQNQDNPCECTALFGPLWLRDARDVSVLR